MGLERYVVASALNGMLAQRLVRRACTQCAYQIDVPENAKSHFETHEIPVEKLLDTMGCDACHQTGYSGRIGIFELIEADDELKDLVKSEKMSRVALSDALVGRGHHGLRREGLLHAANGITTLDEVMRVT